MENNPKRMKSCTEVEILHQSFIDCLLSKPLWTSDDEVLGLTNVRVTIQRQEHQKNRNTQREHECYSKWIFYWPNLISSASSDGAASGKLAMKMNFLFWEIEK